VDGAVEGETLGKLLHNILPAGAPNAAVVLVGTPVGMGSVMHDVVRAARGRAGPLADRGEWVRAKGFDPHWYPAITEEGGSAWPTRHPIGQLVADRAADPGVFALQWMCDPDDPAAVVGWSDDTFRYAPMFDPEGTLWRIGSIDGAVTSRNDGSADHSAFVGVIVGRDGPAGRQVCVEEATSGSWDDQDLLERVWAWARAHPRARKILIVEGNQGGEMWERALQPLPPGVELEPAYHVAQPKAYRIKSLLREYRRGAVVHEAQLTGLEAQMVAWRPGAGGHGVDDLIDATRAAVDRALYGDASRSPESGDGHDPVTAPSHYRGHPSGIECIQVTEHMSFCLGNAVKYIWRADLKDDALEDLRKAAWYVQREIARREGSA
jgi:hypothetical protein